MGKAAKAASAKVRKANKGEAGAKKKVKNEVDEFDMMTDDKNTSLSKKLGGTPDGIAKGKGKGRAPKGTPKKGKAKNPWSDSDGDDVDGSDLSDAMDDVVVAPERRRPV